MCLHEALCGPGISSKYISEAFASPSSLHSVIQETVLTDAFDWDRYFSGSILSVPYFD